MILMSVSVSKVLLWLQVFWIGFSFLLFSADSRFSASWRLLCRKSAFTIYCKANAVHKVGNGLDK